MNKLTCPKCGHMIYCWETIDEIMEGSTIKILWAGGCLNCETDYQWWGAYNFSRIEDLKEVE